MIVQLDFVLCQCVTYIRNVRHPRKLLFGLVEQGIIVVSQCIKIVGRAAMPVSPLSFCVQNVLANILNMSITGHFV